MEPSDELFSRVQIPMHRYLPDEEEYKEVFETVSLIDLQPHEICDYCQSIPFDLLGFHGKILMEELDRLFPGLQQLEQVLLLPEDCHDLPALQP
jgi:hypothetical protein